MASWLEAIGTATGAHDYAQAELAERLGALLGGQREARVLRELARQSQVERRQSILADFEVECTEPRLYGGEVPGTAARSRLYEQAAPGLAAAAAAKALAKAGREAAEITHLITVSCTGFFAPGLDVGLIGRLGLGAGVKRYQLGFMGCCAALPALDLAAELVRADAAAVVLVTCCELCSLHFQGVADRDNLLSASLFGDGAAVAVVGGGGGLARLGRHGSSVIPDSADAMSWRVGDTGFRMGLAKEVPETLATALRGLLQQPEFRCDPKVSEIDWAVHPGGAAILDACEAGLGLGAGALTHSRAVMRAHGNMSSATILFVLEQQLRAGGLGPVCALAFGPGLTANWLWLEQ